MHGVDVTGAGTRLFSEDEFRRRRGAVAALLAEHDLSYALVYGANRSGSGVSWLTDWSVTREAMLVLSPEAADDLLLVNFYNHLPQAQRMARVPVAWAGGHATATALTHIRSRQPRPKRIGLIGPVPFDQYTVLAQAVESVVNLNRHYTMLRLVKSDEEIAALEAAAALTDVAMTALIDRLQARVSEHELLAAIESASVARGGMHHISYLGTTSMADPALCVPGQWATARRVRSGDVVLAELSAAVAPEYAGQVLRTCTVGGAPTPLYAELHSVAMAAFEAVSDRLVPGTHSSELATAAAFIDEAGFTTVDDLVHGFGGGYLPPIVRGSGHAADDVTLATGMTVVVQPNVVTPDHRAGVQTGELLLVTDAGPRRLHTFPPGLRVVD